MRGLKSQAFIVLWGALFVASNFALLTPFGVSSGAGDMLIKALPLVIAGIVACTSLGQRDKFRSMANSVSFLLPLLLLSVIGVLSGLWSANPGYSIFRAALSLVFYIGMGCYAGYVQYNCSNRQEAVRLLFMASALAVSLISLMGLFKFEQAYRFTEYLYGRRLGGTIVHPNALGLTAGMVILMFVNRLVINRERPQLIDAVLLASCTYALLATQSRSALLITVICAATSLLASRVSLLVKLGLPLVACIGLLLDAALRPGSDTLLRPVLDFLARDASAEDLPDAFEPHRHMGQNRYHAREPVLGQRLYDAFARRRRSHRPIRNKPCSQWICSSLRRPRRCWASIRDLVVCPPRECS